MELLSAAPVRAVDFGRWQTSTSRCSWQRGPSSPRHDCQGLRLEQNLEGFLNVRFLADGQGDPIALEQLVFAGALESDHGAMRCDSDGRCRPQWPARLAVATVADASFNQRGLVMGLPRTHLARGHCQLERTRVHCQARGQGGETWIAEAELSGQPAHNGPAGTMRAAD
ncbi:hypothetical protein KBY96_08415 [Cyanobium sp. ATX 6A2]|uniref:hypothetical protein n=1 Tax=Cyanobium sp. ATX 6A2 TaxID=2823700 RepID=UPI0020CDEE9E|nr:hypothetical protein [Cyanobium sp. ATX 6A2]MCP9887949.1 hypothetical protein [Cyanobium sp. ATX 6A2]